MKTSCLIAFLSLALCCASTANAAVVAFNITATVNEVYDQYNLLGGSILVGDTLTGVLQYDLALLDNNPALDEGSYFAQPPGNNFFNGANNDSDGFFVTTDYLFVDIQNDSVMGEDYLGFYASGDTIPSSSLEHPNVDYVDLEIYLHDTDRTAISDGSLPTSLDLADFEIAVLEFSAEGMNDLGWYELTYFVGATITGITPVPEPGSITLLLCGLAGLICWRRGR